MKRLNEDAVRRMPSQADIAAAARVSTATVSRVVNNSKLVRPEVRDRVRAEMERLGYFTHGAARALAYNKSWTIGAVIPTLNSDLFARSIDALMRRLREMDYSLMVVSSDYSLDDETFLIKRLLERGVDGIFLVGGERLPQSQKLLKLSHRPYIESYITDVPGNKRAIGFNNAKACSALVEHLVELGHRRIGMLAGITRYNDRARKRLEGFRQSMSLHGLPVADHHVREVNYDIDEARREFSLFLEDNDPPTALVCGNDLIAMGALIEANARGIDIPRCMSIVGIDNHPLSRHSNPPLTTIDIPAIQIGIRSAEALVAAIETGAPVNRHDLEAPLIIRETTSSPASSQ
ncbi:MAG: transcriptional regulator [marine bacterium B5-7]|nr:MAG: transcriptional regulator [marine bacterium B5-7]